MGEGFAGHAVIGEGDDEAMLGFKYFGRRVEHQPLGMAAEIGDGDEQVERLALRQQARTPWR